MCINVQDMLCMSRSAAPEKWQHCKQQKAIFNRMPIVISYNSFTQGSYTNVVNNNLAF